MKHEFPTQPGRRSGFTLLEMMLSIAVFLLLVASAFTLVGATTELMTEVSEVQNNSSLRHRFVDTCRAAFESTTSSSSLAFHYYGTEGSGQSTYLVLSNAPGAFDFGKNLQDQINKVVLASEPRPDGLSRIGVYYLTDDEYEVAKEAAFQGLDAPYVELIPRIRYLAWRFYDGEDQEWVQTLDGELKTSLVELSFQTADDTHPLRTVFYCLNER